jgi:GH25 family lysozyme M1 (1,4-beta-N-acetylmuramidase)
LPDYWDCASISDGVQRQEAVYIIYKALNVTSDEPKSDFTDGGDIASWALDAVETMVAAGYIDGYPDGSFRPEGTLTRAEAVTIIDKILGDNYITFGSLVLKKLDIPEYSLDNSLFSYDENGWKTYLGSDDVTVGIDVSAYQYDIDWQAVADSGIDFAMIRVGFRGWGKTGSLNIDKYALQNLQGAIDAGLDVGVYFFSQALNTAEAEAEAELVLDIIKDYNITYPVVFDWEEIGNSSARTNGMTKTAITDCALAFCEKIEAAGYTPMVYYYKYLGLVKYDLTRIHGRYDVWFAQVTSLPNYPYEFQMWQYATDGTVPGITGGVDMNICFKNYG